MGANSDSLAVVDVSTPASPVVLGGVKDSTHMDGAHGVAFDPARKLGPCSELNERQLAMPLIARALTLMPSPVF